ncbi:Toluene-4-sulfonate monooxygenase system iron-sulfur subunit TsaM1 [Pigmentiphaga humi]|uniref:Toluene-4-sulfonate monooxygenase system iron-sulfur subunit TsaM1 n=1 Tax=Pigmentiphaga humi TaxID=2478468 RepID=A0A3P4AVJ4_9BURK|nr:aromatic ring-hydroxylating dioxygenase subunit alpha [Pigmentiphaga humi]VCU68049.1 Toluene-4-sulfonate monooxygenase system iron-sulfur subunit TsaM1 [Pigmentiphaga humi]
MGNYVLNHWYAAAWSSEIGAGPLGRRLLDEPVVLFRQADGSVAALADRCPHRLVPLSMGTCVEGRLQCTYHGLQFDGGGRCVHIPGQATIPPKASTRSFPVVERYGVVWIWMGEAERADPVRLFSISKHGQAGWDVIDGGYQRHPSNYVNIIENLMDPAHTTFLHSGTIGNPLAGEQPVATERTDDYIVAYRWLENTSPSPHDRRRLNVGDVPVDRGQFFYFHLPSTSRVETIVLPAGAPRDTDEQLCAGLRTYSYKFLTPETASSTHFFWMHVRNYQVGDDQAAAMLRAALERTYQEDLEIELAMQRAQEETGLRQLVSLRIDHAPVMAARMLAQMVEDERA